MTPLSPFEFVPPFGFREYCYSALFKKVVAPTGVVFVKIMGEDIVFFRGKVEKTHALFHGGIRGWGTSKNSRG